MFCVSCGGGVDVACWLVADGGAVVCVPGVREGGEPMTAQPNDRHSESAHLALSFDVGDGALWTKRHRFDPAAAQLADRHYSREVVGSPQVGGPGRILVFVTPDERAVWISKVHVGDALPARAAADGFCGYRCAMFRNESDTLASDLIREAVRLTEQLWGPSAHGWATYVDRSRVASRNPGYCFRRAGWTRDREYDHPHLFRFLLAPPQEMEMAA